MYHRHHHDVQCCVPDLFVNDVASFDEWMNFSLTIFTVKIDPIPDYEAYEYPWYV